MDTALDVDLKYVNGFCDRHGKRWRYYFRRKGSPRVALPGEPLSPEFMAAYHEALAAPVAKTTVTKAAAGTLGELRDTYYASAEFRRNLRPTTQRETRYVIDALCAMPNRKLGTNEAVRVSHIERRHILKWRDDMADRPGAANKMLGVVKSLLTFAVDRGYRKDNPAAGIKRLKIGRFRSWTDAELAAFEERWPLGTLERTGYALALYSAQRRADLVTLKWSSIAGNVIHVTQSKTGTDVGIYMHPDLRAALAAVQPRRGETVLTAISGKPLNPIYFGHIMAEAIDKAELPNECVLHGLRKTAARIVAETGGKVGSMTGHLTRQMEDEYSRGADQRANSKASVIKWAKARKAK